MATATKARQAPDTAGGNNGGGNRRDRDQPRGSGASFVRTWALVGGLTALVAGLPLAVALGVLRHPRWYPLLDLAQTEMRVRDVGSRDTPLVGLAGRFDALGQRGSHPGPISFWALWPFYKLFGSTAWALQAAAASLNVIATGLAIWIGKRRGSARLALGVAAAMAILLRLYGADKLTEAWNPYMPMLWWAVFLLAVWSVLCDDLPMLPVAVLAGTFCMQTHVPYTGIVAGVGAVTVLLAGSRLLMHWADRELRSRVLRWIGASLVLLALLWAPPLVDQLTNDPGNLTILRESLANPEEERVEPGDAVSVWLAHMNVADLVVPPATGTDRGDTIWPGAVLLAVWALAAGVTWLGWAVTRRRRSASPGTGPGRAGPPGVALTYLHLVVAAALLFGLVSIARITGLLWYYLVLWSWGTTVLMVVAVAWTVGALLRRPEGPRPGVALLAVLVLVVTTAFAYDAAHTDVPAPTEAAMLAAVAPPAVEALGRGDLPGGGMSGRYLVLWESDALGIGSQGYGLLLELERKGFDAGASRREAVGVVEHRVLDPRDATAIVHYVVGEETIEQWRETPEAVLATEVDLRTPVERRRFDELHDEVAAGLREAGRTDLLGLLDRRLFLLAVHDDLPPELVPSLREMMQLGVPAAVFVTPPDVLQPS